MVHAVTFRAHLQASARRLAATGLKRQQWRGYTSTGAVCSRQHDGPTDVTAIHKTPTVEKVEKDPAIERLFTMNRAWVDRVNRDDPSFFPNLAKGQSPEYLYIGCSDSRVAVNDLMGVEMGELFVHRNIANMVVSSDLNLLAVLTYAVEHLKVKHILVTGHYDCGGIRAAVQKQDKGQILDAWLQSIRDVHRLHKPELDRIVDDEARHRRLVELNVYEQCLNLYKTPVVQRRRLETYNDVNQAQTVPRIHGLVFDPATGILSKIPLDFRRTVADLRDTYDLFDTAEYEASYLLKRQTSAGTDSSNGGSPTSGSNDTQHATTSAPDTECSSSKRKSS